MLPSFMPRKGVGLEPSCQNQAVCLGFCVRCPTQEQGRGNAQMQTRQPPPILPLDSSVLALLPAASPGSQREPWHHFGEGAWGTEGGRTTASPGALRDRVWRVASRDLPVLEPFTWASVYQMRHGFEWTSR